MDSRIFSFDSFDIRLEKGEIQFHYSVDGKLFFDPTLQLDLSSVKDVKDIEAAVFALGMAELIHFWKATLAPEIHIKAGSLNEEQITFWKELYIKGLSEFFYVNEIDFRDLIHITVDQSASERICPTPSVGHKGSFKALVPFGGGKDSIVTGEKLKEKGIGFSWFTLEQVPFAEKVFAQSPTEECFNIERSVAEYFKKVIELVKQGAPNGHVPISATYMLSAVLVAQIHGFSHVVFSTERSAEEGNVEYLGMEINHQYSKTFAYEKRAHEYITKYVAPDISVFSLLRNLYEVQILKEFIRYPKYFESFVSCNRGLKSALWCGECAKCAFLFAGLVAFASPEDAQHVFDKDLFDDEALLPLYKELIGKEGHKPFDCVGTLKENLLLLYLAKEKYAKIEHMPYVLQKLDVSEGERYMDILEKDTNEHLIPEKFL